MTIVIGPLTLTIAPISSAIHTGKLANEDVEQVDGIWPPPPPGGSWAAFGFGWLWGNTGFCLSGRPSLADRLFHCAKRTFSFIENCRLNN